MRKALRPYLTAGVAVVGASAVAIAPVIATPPDVKIVNPAVRQTAGPLESYVETVREALENLEALLGSALALPTPTGWTLELALDNLLRDPGGNVALFVDELEALGPLAGSSVPALLDYAADTVETSIAQIIAGNIDLAIVGLIRTYVTLAPVVVAVVSAPLKLLGPELGETASVVLAKSLNAAVGPVLSGIGSTGVALQTIVNALNDAKPGSGEVLQALAAAPATVADGVLNGFTLAPGPAAFPGLLTPGDPFDPTKPNPGPVFLAVGLARGFGGVVTPRPTATNVTAPVTERMVTIPVKPGETTTEQPRLGDDAKETEDLDDITNTEAIAGPRLPATAQHAPRFGRNATTRSPGAGGLTTWREGMRDEIRNGVHHIRQGVRDAVKAVAGSNKRAESTPADAEGSP